MTPWATEADHETVESLGQIGAQSAPPDELIIVGPVNLSGSVVLSGSKNESLGTLACTLLGDGQSRLARVPQSLDVAAMVRAMQTAGAHVVQQADTIAVNASGIRDPFELSLPQAASTRGIVYFAAVAAARGLNARISIPGGDQLPSRGMDLHLASLRSFGADVRVLDGSIVVIPAKLSGCRVKLTAPSASATLCAVIAASGASGKSAVENSSCNPETVATLNALCAMGVRLNGIGTRTVEIIGGRVVEPLCTTISADRNEFATWALAAAATRGTITMSFADLSGMDRLVSLLVRLGSVVAADGDCVSVRVAHRCPAFSFQAGPYPELQSDWQPLATALAAVSRGVSDFSDIWFPERRSHIAQLRAMGADIAEHASGWYVSGRPHLCGRHVSATDIRCGAALVLAALVSRGETCIHNAHHLARGYEFLPAKLVALGARVSVGSGALVETEHESQHVAGGGR